MSQLFSFTRSFPSLVRVWQNLTTKLVRDREHVGAMAAIGRRERERDDVNFHWAFINFKHSYSTPLCISTLCNSSKLSLLFQPHSLPCQLSPFTSKLKRQLNLQPVLMTVAAAALCPRQSWMWRPGRDPGPWWWQWTSTTSYPVCLWVSLPLDLPGLSTSLSRGMCVLVDIIDLVRKHTSINYRPE